MGILEIDKRLESDGRRVGFTGGPGSARALLSSIASSTLTLTALVFSITIVVLQLASSQFSPRVLRTFLRDQRNQLTLGIFLATFVYALLVLREIRGDDGVAEQFVPGVSIAVSFGLVLVSVGLFIQYIHNIARSIRVIEIIDRVSSETAGAIDRTHPSDAPPIEDRLPAASASTRMIRASTRGVVTSVDVDRLGRAAERADVVLAVLPRPGEFRRRNGTPPRTRLSASVNWSNRRTGPVTWRERPHDCDPVPRSPARSPTRHGGPPPPGPLDRGTDGVLRAVAPQPSWDDYVRLALDEIRHWGAGSIQVHQRIGSLLDDLVTVVGPERLDVLHEQRRLLHARLDDLPPAERTSVQRRDA